jgi:inosose dehydratase
MYTPLGAGDVDIAGIVKALRANGFDGWFVMEQDTILDAEPTEGSGTRPPVEDVRVSLDHLRDVAATLDPGD